MVATVQASYAAGEISSELYGRVDQALYYIGLARAQNMVVQQTGGIYNRAGLRYIGNVKNHDEGAWLVPFKFSAQDTYVLEFGEQYIRFIRNDAHITEDGINITGITKGAAAIVTAPSHGYETGDDVFISGVAGMKEINQRWFRVVKISSTKFKLQSQVNDTDIVSTNYASYTSSGKAYKIYEIDTPYSFDDLPELKFSQSADVVTFTHIDYPPMKLKRYSHTNWVFDILSFGAGVGIMEGLAQTYTSTSASSGFASSTYYGVIIVARNDTFNLEGLPALGRYGYDITNIEVLLGGNSVKVTYNTTKIEFLLSSGEGYLYTATEGRYFGLKDRDIIYIDGVVGDTSLNGKYFTITNITSTTFTLVDTAKESFNYISGGTINACTINTKIVRKAINNVYHFNIIFTFTLLAGIDKYIIYIKDSSNSTPTFRRMRSIEISNSDIAQGYTVVDASFLFTKNNATLASADYKNFYDAANDKYKIASNVFSGANDRPSVVGFFQQRAIFGSTKNNPENLYYSAVGDYKTFETKRKPRNDILSDDEPIVTTLSSGEINNIRHLIGLNDLLILTDSAQWQVRPSVGSGLSAKTIEQRPQARVGTSNITPVVFDDTIIYIREGNQSVIGLGYNRDREGYVPVDLSLLSNHMFDNNPILSIAGTYVPRKQLYCVLTSGEVACLTFVPNQKITAWTRWYTDGLFESVAVARPDAGSVANDEAYFVVQRQVNGDTVRYIERTDNRQFKSAYDSFFVDAGLTYDNPIEISNVVTGEATTVTTTVAHGLVVGSKVALSDIQWAKKYDDDFLEIELDQLNERKYTVKTVSGTSFTIGSFDDNTDIDSSAFTAYISGGRSRYMAQTLRGLWYLEGKEVVALVDGNVVDNLTVENGSVILPHRGGRIHIGLRYISEIETLALAIQEATVQGLLKSLTSVSVGMYRSRGLLLAPKGGKFYELPTRSDEAWGVPTKLLTEDITIPMHSHWGKSGAFILRQKNPLPMGILYTVPVFDLGDPR